MMNFQDYIRPELLILIPVLYLIGAGIKKSRIRDTLIPLLLGLAGVLLAAIYIYAVETAETLQDTATMVFTAVTQGILCAGAAVYANQIYKQSKKDD